MYHFILIVQIVSIIGLFAEAWIVVRKWQGPLHSYLLLSILSILINNLGYLVEMQTRSEEACLTALQFSYLGRVWTGFFLLLFIAELCSVHISRILKTVLAVFHTATYGVILTIRHHALYYKDIRFEQIGEFAYLRHSNGIWHTLQMDSVVAYILCCLVILFLTYRRQKNRTLRMRVLIITLTIVAEASFFIAQILGTSRLTEVYDVTMLGSAVGTLFLLAALFRYDLLGTKELAKDYILDRMSDGIVAVDARGELAYCNKPAGILLPDLQSDAPAVLRRLEECTAREKPLPLGDRIFTPRKDTLRRGEEISGLIYVLQDNTDLYRKQSGLQMEVGRQTARADRLSLEMMIALARAVDAKDHYTNGHSGRVADYAAEIARRMGKSEEEQEKIFEMGLMHDIGKIGVSEEIINKTSRLTDDEFTEIKEHTLIGYSILSSITEMPDLSAGARSHHEKWDGTGYPDGLAGEDIPLEARIICVADCYDAMTSTRTYSTPCTQEKVRTEILRCAGTQFDPKVAEIMIRMIDDDTEYRMNADGDTGFWKNRHLLAGIRTTL